MGIIPSHLIWFCSFWYYFRNCFFLTRSPSNSIRQNNGKTCNYITNAELSIGQTQLIIPAKKGTTIKFPYLFDNPLPTQRVNVENDIPWKSETRGFCQEHLIGQPDPESIRIERTALIGVASELELPSEDTIYRLTFGTKGVGSWLSPNPIHDNLEKPEDMILKKPFNDVLRWQLMETAGWLGTGHRISSWCSEMHNRTVITCNVRITRRLDGMVFEAWGLQISNMPHVNQRPPKEFMELVHKLPRILDLYK